MKRRVVITGIGALSCLGNNALCQYHAAVDAISGITELPVMSGVPPVQTKIVGKITGNLPNLLDNSTLKMFDQVSHIGWYAVHEAIAQAGLDSLGEEDLFRSGIFWGTGLGGATTIEETYDDLFLKKKGRAKPYTVIGVMANSTAALLSMKTKFQGPCITYATACTSSAHAIGEAFRQILGGYCDRAIAGGSESMNQNAALHGWEALRTLAQYDEKKPYASCKPFSKNRSGFVIGEGSAALILESYESAIARGANILAEIIGYGTTVNGSHITKPNVMGQARAIQNALTDANLSFSEITYVNAHGTATIIGDIAETESIKLAFGDHANSLLISSTKAIHGHTFGAAGALELIITIQAQINGVAPPTAFLDEADPECNLNFIPNQAVEIPIKYAMSNSFAFGGSNVVIITKV
jgi:3-oxoacyl-[acyl-carrier-protein] synthase II